MNICVFFPLWVGVVFLFCRNKVYNENTLSSKTENNISLFTAIIIFLPVVLYVVLLEITSMGDYWGYINNYLNLNMTFSDIDWTAKEPGFDFIRVLIKSIFGNNEFAFRLSIALMQIIPIIFVFRKYSNNYYFTAFLFITNGIFLAWMMNGIRQFLAVCLIFAFTPILLRKNTLTKYIILIVVIMLAYTIHNSALIMLPVVFIVQGKAWNKWTVLASVIMVLLFSNVSLLDSVIGSAGLDYSISGIKQAGDDGANIFRVLVNLIPVILSYIYRKELDTDNKVINICTNMTLINACIYILSMFTSGVLIGRLPGYTIMYSFILLPYLLKYSFDEAKSKNLTIFLVCLYFAYYCYQIF